MKFLIYLKDLFIEVLNQSLLGVSFINILIILFALTLAFLIRGFVANIILIKIKKFFEKTGNTVDDHIYNSLIPPLKLLPVVVVFIFISINIESDSNLAFYIEKINRSLATILVFWLFHQLLNPISQLFNKLEEIFSKALIVWLTKSFKYLIIFLGTVAFLEIWGIKIGPIIAGLGLFGVAVALGSQDLFKNLISGILIIIEKRFNLDDVIELPGKAIGTVERIGFRSTSLRLFDTSLITLPNHVFSEASIINYSKRKFRRINWNIGLVYKTSLEQLKSICEQITLYIKNSDNFVVNDEFKLFVRVEKFNDSSIDLLVYTFTSTNDWEKYLMIKEELIFQIKSIVEENSTDFAFPSTSIYLEKNDNFNF